MSKEEMYRVLMEGVEEEFRDLPELPDSGPAVLSEPFLEENEEPISEELVIAWLQNPNRDPLQTSRIFCHLFREDDCLKTVFPLIPNDVLLRLSDFFLRQKEGSKARHLLELAHSHNPSFLQGEFPPFGTLLHKAASLNQLEAVKFLIEQNILSVNAIGPRASTPLHFAAWYGRAPVVHFLIEKGADLTLRDETKNRNTPFLVALSSKYPDLETFELLYPKDKQFPTDESGAPLPLHLASLSNLPREKILQRLLDDGLDPLQKECHGKTALSLACERRALICVELFSRKIAATDPTLLIPYSNSPYPEVRAIIEKYV